MPKTDHRVTLTPTKVAGLKLAKPGQRYQVMDAAVAGFGVRIGENTKTFILRTRFPGSDSASRREIGKCGDIGLAEAREKARQWRQLISKGIDPADQERRQREAAILKKRTTFAAVVDDFIHDKLSTERNGADAERQIRRDLMPAWAELAITEMTSLQISALVKAKARKRPGMPKSEGSGGPAGARSLLALISRFFRWVVAQPEYGLTVSPCANLTPSILGEAPAPAIRTLSNDELFAFWRAAGRMPYPTGAVYRLLCLTALRLNEVAEASWSEVNRREGVWVIPAARMKGKNGGKKQARAHAVPLTKDILAVIDGLPRFKGGEFLFSTTAGQTPVWIGSKIKDRLDARMLRKLRALARKRGDDPNHVSLPPFVNHDIRRTVRSQLSRLKISEEAREAVLAHVRPGIKGVYDLHDYLDEKREALELWSARLKRITSPQEGNVVQLKGASGARATTY
jgi:integrase